MANDNVVIQVEVVYASTTTSRNVSVNVAKNSTVLDAIIASNIQQIFPEIDLSKNKVGIFSHIVSLQDKVQDGDRVEIYRPLITNPKQQRKLKAKQQKHLRKP